MGVLRIPDLQIDKENPDEGIKKLVKEIKPKWNVDNLVTEDVVGGYSSKMFKCYISSGDSEDAIIIRLQHLLQEMKGEMEIQAIEFMSKIGHFTEIHAIFSNGYCYQFIAGKPVVNVRLKTGKITDEILEAIAEELAFIHSIKLTNFNYEFANCFTTFKKVVTNTEFKNPPDSAPSKETSLQEMDIINDFLKSLNTPIVTCHGDIHPGNFVWNDETKQIVFVDWELTRIGCEFEEVANFITTMKLFDSLFKNKKQMEITQDAEEKFVKFYFDARSKYPVLKSYSYDEYKELIQKFKLGRSLAGVIFQLIQPDVMNELAEEVDMIQFYNLGLQGYLQLKKQFLGTDRFG